MLLVSLNMIKRNKVEKDETLKCTYCGEKIPEGDFWWSNEYGDKLCTNCKEVLVESEKLSEW